MKLGKVKKICTAAEQLCVLDLPYTENMVLQWVGTADAMYPMRQLQLSREQLQQVWELGEGMVNAMEMHPVTHDEELFAHVPGQMAMEDTEPLVVAEVNGYWALRCGEKNMLFVVKELFAPCLGGGPVRLNLELDANGDWWVAIYVDGVLDGLVRPVDGRKAATLHRMICNMAQLAPLPAEKVVEDEQEPVAALPPGEQQSIVLPDTGEVL